MQHARNLFPLAEDLADATVREIERLARELLRRGGEK